MYVHSRSGGVTVFPFVWKGLMMCESLFAFVCLCASKPQRRNLCVWFYPMPQGRHQSLSPCFKACKPQVLSELLLLSMAPSPRALACVPS